MAKHIGEIIRRLREKRGWSQGQLSMYSNLDPEKRVSRPTISFMEKGEKTNPTIDTLGKLASALKASVDEMLIELGMLPHRDDIGPLSPTEQELIENLRSISRPEEREEILNHVLGLVRFSADVDSIVQERLREASEGSEGPGEEPTED